MYYFLKIPEQWLSKLWQIILMIHESSTVLDLKIVLRDGIVHL